MKATVSSTAHLDEKKSCFYTKQLLLKVDPGLQRKYFFLLFVLKNRGNDNSGTIHNLYSCSGPSIRFASLSSTVCFSGKMSKCGSQVTCFHLCTIYYYWSIAWYNSMNLWKHNGSWQYRTVSSIMTKWYDNFRDKWDNSTRQFYVTWLLRWYELQWNKVVYLPILDKHIFQTRL